MSFDCQVYVGVLSKECSIIAVSGPGHDGKYIGEVTKPTITNRAHVFHLSFFYMCVWVAHCPSNPSAGGMEEFGTSTRPGAGHRVPPY
jgi:hypothetical protein